MDFEKISRSPYWRHIWMSGLSFLVVAIVIRVSLQYSEPLFGISKAHSGTLWVPYLTSLAGVLLFILNTARKKGDQWSLLDYWGAHVFRIAQAIAYVFVVLWAVYSQPIAPPTENGGGETTTGASPLLGIGPNMIGFFVGLYIVRVERAMEALGERFEEALMVLLPATMRQTTAAEKRRQSFRTLVKVDEIATQWEAVRSQVTDPALSARFDEMLSAAQAAVRKGEDEATQEQVGELARTFEQIKHTAGETWVPLDELIGR